MKIALCCLSKNCKTIKQYCQYYLDLDFDVFIYDDYSNFSYEKLLKEDDLLNKVHLEKSPDLDISIRKLEYQVLVYDMFFQKYKNDYDWIAFFDDDEYLVLNDSIENILDDNYKNIIIKWEFYRKISIYKTEQSDWVKFDFPEECDYKAIVNTKKVKNIITVHSGDYVSYDISSKDKSIYDIKNINKNQVYIRHEFLPSFEEYAEKLMLRGDLLLGNRMLKDWFISTNYSENEQIQYYNEIRNKIKLSNPIVYNIEDISFETFSYLYYKSNFNIDHSLREQGNSFYTFFTKKNLQIPTMSQLINMLKIIARFDIIALIYKDPINYAHGIPWDYEFFNDFVKRATFKEFANNHPDYLQYKKSVNSNYQTYKKYVLPV